QGQSGQSPYLLLKLGAQAGFDSMVTAVMWARGNFIRNQAPISQYKKLYAQHTDIICSSGNFLCYLLGLVIQRMGLFTDARNHQNTVTVSVMRGIKIAHLTVGPSDQHH